jgi:hypothetical protein
VNEQSRLRHGRREFQRQVFPLPEKALQTAQSVARPVLQLENVNFERPPAKGAHLVVVALLRNYGQAAAEDVRVHWNVITEPYATREFSKDTFETLLVADKLGDVPAGASRHLRMGIVVPLEYDPLMYVPPNNILALVSLSYRDPSRGGTSTKRSCLEWSRGSDATKVALTMCDPDDLQ